MNSPFFRQLSLLLLVGFLPGLTLWLVPIPASAQAPAPTVTPGEAPLSIESVKKLLEQTEADTALEEAGKAELKTLLEGAIGSLTTASDFTKKAEELKQSAEKGPAEIDTIRGEMEKRKSGEIPEGGKDTAELPVDATAEMINTRLTSEKARVTDLTRQLRELETRLTEIEIRPQANRERVLAATRLLSEAQTSFARWNGQSVSTLKDKAALASDQAKIQALQSELVMLEQESLSFALQKDLTEARRNLTSSDLGLTRDRITRLESRSGALVSARIGEAQRLVSDLGIEEISDDPLLQSLLKETRELTSKNQIVLSRIAVADAKLKEAEAYLSQLERDSKSIRAQIEIGGIEGEFSEKILELRESLPKADSFYQDASARRKEVSDARLDAYRMDDELDSLPPPAEQLKTLLKSIEPQGLSEEDLKKIEPVLKNLTETRVRLRKDAAEGNRRLAEILGEIDLIESNTIATAAGFRDYLGEKLIWVASSPPLGTDAFTGFRTAFILLLGPDALGQYVKALTRIHPSRWILAILLAAALLLPRNRLRRYLAVCAGRTRKVSQDSIGHTLGAFASTIILALPVPTLLLFFGWVFRNDINGTEATYALGKGLAAPALLLFVCRFLAHLCAPGGVGEVHFRWNRLILNPCQLALTAAIFLYLPAHMLLAIWFHGTNLSAFQGPGRLVFIVAMILIAIILQRLFGQIREAFAGSGSTRRWIIKLRKIWTASLILLPVALAVLAALGYFLTAVVLAYQIQNTALVVLGGVLIYALLTRWVAVRERRIALQNAVAAREARRLAQIEAVAAAESGSEAVVENTIKDESFVPIEEDEVIDWNVVGEQTRHLIRAMVTVMVIFGCWLVWSEVLPVLKYLDARNVIGGISISDLIWLGIVTLITSVVFQNLPGLLEVTFLRDLELESGVRTAIITICQYTIIAIGAALAFQALGLDMSKFGWIAAALSVGLGFGLQEIVSNFVSGVILLFERPIRVGDIVTVAGVDGVVTKIRIRATTITNWDKKEFIVPNKEFVTGTLMNWTLTNAMIRMVFPVGIAYGSDIRKTQDILLDIARSQPEVLKDPEPVAVFELFGDSALNFSLRLYVPRPEIRLEMTHRINTLIHDRFLAAGIEMPFPQRDLHLRSIDPSIRIGQVSADVPGA